MLIMGEECFHFVTFDNFLYNNFDCLLNAAISLQCEANKRNGNHPIDNILPTHKYQMPRRNSAGL